MRDRVRAWFADLLFSCAIYLSRGEWRSSEVAQLRRNNMILQRESARWRFRAERMDGLVRHWQKEAKLAKAGLAVDRTPVHVDVRIN